MSTGTQGFGMFYLAKHGSTSSGWTTHGTKDSSPGIILESDRIVLSFKMDTTRRSSITGTSTTVRRDVVFRSTINKDGSVTGDITLNRLSGYSGGTTFSTETFEVSRPGYFCKGMHGYAMAFRSANWGVDRTLSSSFKVNNSTISSFPKTMNNSQETQHNISLPSGDWFDEQWTFDWAPIHKVVFDNNSSFGIINELTGFDGDTVTIPSSGFSKPLHEFIGFNTSPDGTGTDYAFNQTVTFPKQDDPYILTLYPKYNYVGFDGFDKTPISRFDTISDGGGGTNMVQSKPNTCAAVCSSIHEYYSKMAETIEDSSIADNE